MIQSGDLEAGDSMTQDRFLALGNAAVDQLDVAMARKEVEPFVKNPENLGAWSSAFLSRYHPKDRTGLAWCPEPAKPSRIALNLGLYRGSKRG